MREFPRTVTGKILIFNQSQTFIRYLTFFHNQPKTITDVFSIPVAEPAIPASRGRFRRAGLRRKPRHRFGDRGTARRLPIRGHAVAASTRFPSHSQKHRNPMSRIIPDPIANSATPLPTEAEVVIIGGGIIGVCTALYLAQQNVRVVVCEKGLIGAEQSARNWGWVRQMGRDPAEIPLSIESLRLWHELKPKYGAETGLRQTGITYLCRNEAQMAEYREWIGHAREYGIDTVLFGKNDLAQYVPGCSTTFAGGMHTATDGRAEPLMAAPAIAHAAQRAGAHIATRCAVRGIQREAGRVSGVVTEHGEIRCSSVVLAGGAWSRLFAGSFGLELPQLKVLGSAARISDVNGPTAMPVGADNFSFRQRLDGGYTIAMRNSTLVPIVPDSFRLFPEYWSRFRRNRADLKLRLDRQFIDEWRTPRQWALDAITPFEKHRILDPKPSEAVIRNGLANLAKAFPAFANARILQMWGGMIDVTPDAVPIIGPLAALPGFFIATGFSGHGFGLGPGAGKLMAQLVTNETPLVDPAPFRFERFARFSAAGLMAA
ncbi:FAD-binding oxidoreductase [Burkholderia sp. Ax-1724]|uniref:NAD(P)/FAD-dependent oxidoreductase n=1 Tax=Burkholderia sp. Ax-1724 TaxID=2608336 RepID=UPI001F03C414|nr:FAD-binding oxidoreductase [Burkholderia sp. Ax-1724]